MKIDFKLFRIKIVPHPSRVWYIYSLHSMTYKNMQVKSLILTQAKINLKLASAINSIKVGTQIAQINNITLSVLKRISSIASKRAVNIARFSSGPVHTCTCGQK